MRLRRDTLRTTSRSDAPFHRTRNGPRPLACLRPGLSPANAPPPELRAYLDGGEEERNFPSGCFERVRTVDGICLDRLCEILTDRPRSGVRRVGGSHDLTGEGDRIFSFEHPHDN